VDLRDPDLSRWKGDLEKVIAALKLYHENQVLANLRPLVIITCSLCDRIISRNEHGVKATGEMRCPNPACRAIFDVGLTENEPRYALREQPYQCVYCRTANIIPAHRITDGFTITCKSCDRRVRVTTGLSLQPLDGDPGSASDADKAAR
jgi:hypothetical protein